MLKRRKRYKDVPIFRVRETYQDLRRYGRYGFGYFLERLKAMDPPGGEMGGFDKGLKDEN